MDFTRNINNPLSGLSAYELRNRFRPDVTPDEVHEIHYMDEEEQEGLIRELEAEDVKRNIFYARSFRGIGYSFLLGSIFRLYLRPSPVDLLCLVSTIISVCSLPRVKAGAVQLDPPRWLVVVARPNLFLTLAITCWFGPAWYFEGYGGLDLSDDMRFIPFVVLVMAHLVRQFMKAVDVLALEELRYRYLGA